MSISAIPTKYNGVQMRSRLEARWAAFFDLCGWRWDYEPMDFGGYIPDFLLHFAQPVLVDVKPLTDKSEIDYRRTQVVKLTEDWLCGPLEEKLRVIDEAPEPSVDDLFGYSREWELATIDGLVEDISRVRDSSKNPKRGRRVLVLGSTLFSGTYATFLDDDHYLVRCDAYRGAEGCCCDRLALWSGASDSCLSCGAWVEETMRPPVSSTDALALFREAGNRVQWRAPA